MKAVTKPSIREQQEFSRITLKDKLSRLDLLRASRLLGPDGEALIRIGGKREIDFGDVDLTEDRLKLSLPDATVQLYLNPAARNRIAWTCSRCRSACENVGRPSPSSWRRRQP